MTVDAPAEVATVYVLRSETYLPHRDIVGIFTSREKAEAYAEQATPPVEDGEIDEWAVAGAATGPLMPDIESGTRVVRWSDGRCALLVDGFEVPYLAVHDQGVPGGSEEPTTTRVSVIIERPGCGPLLALDTTEDELLRWAPLLANAMAVSAGRTSHGQHSRPLNPHGSAVV